MKVSPVPMPGIGLVLYPNVVLGVSEPAGSVRAGPRVSRDGFGREMPECFYFFRLHVAASRRSAGSRLTSFCGLESDFPSRKSNFCHT